VRHGERNLFRFLHHSIGAVRELLGIRTVLRISSEVAIDHALKKQDKVIALCQAAGAHTYINAIGGTELYDKTEFSRHGIELAFLRSRPVEYPQLGPGFVPSLSIVDMLMFNPLATVRARIADHYELI
jgi:hypothetical protein